jgi:hypothetical protein
MPKVGGRRVLDVLFRKSIEPIKRLMNKKRRTCQRVLLFLI